MNEENEQIKVILPDQYVDKWRNPEGILLKVVLYVEKETLKLKKIFIPYETFKSLEINKNLGKELTFTLGEDDEGRSLLLGVKGSTPLADKK